MVKIKLKFMTIVLKFVYYNINEPNTKVMAKNLIEEIKEYEEAHNYE